MKKRLMMTMIALVLVPIAANAATVAQEDFDGGAVGLISSSVPALDGLAGDYFGVGSRNAWPQGFPSPGVPFSLADDSVVGYSNGGAPFAGDNEGIFGQNSNFDNRWFAISDTREWMPAQLVATWEFDVTGFTDLAFQVDMGGISNASSGGYTVDTDIVFTASIDGGTPQVLLDVNAVDNLGFVTRPMDIGIPSGGGRLLQVVGPGPVTKLLAEDGSVAANTYLDKTPPSGAGQGLMDTFRAAVSGQGASLVITMTASVPFEAAAFDNLVITGDSVVPTKTQTWGGLKSRYR